MEETYTGPCSVPGAPPGTTTNIPGYAITGQQQGNSEYAKTESTKNYEITTREEEQVGTPGTVKRVSASVLVDGTLGRTGRLGGLKEPLRRPSVSTSSWRQLRHPAHALLHLFCGQPSRPAQEQRRQQPMGMIVALVLVGAVGRAW